MIRGNVRLLYVKEDIDVNSSSTNDFVLSTITCETLLTGSNQFKYF